MRTGHGTDAQAARIDYKELRKMTPESSRGVVATLQKSIGHNVSATDRMFGVVRRVVFGILERRARDDLRDQPRTPERQTNKTPPDIEERLVVAKNKTVFGSVRSADHRNDADQPQLTHLVPR